MKLQTKHSSTYINERSDPFGAHFTQIITFSARSEMPNMAGSPGETAPKL